MPDKLSLQVSVVYSPAPRTVHEVALTLPVGSTLLQALHSSGLLQLFPSIHPSNTVPGIWGRQADWGQVLRENDRVELYRALTVDPKMARRERFVNQGARTAGLFIKKRPGAKAGY